MKRVFNCGKKFKAFSMAEMLVVMLILSIVIISMTPIAVKRVKKDAVNPEHGSFECYWDGDKLYQVERNAEGEPLGPGDGRVDRTTQGYCDFVPRRGAMFYTVNAVGGGSPGTGNTEAFKSIPKKGDYSSIYDSAGVNYYTTYRKYRSIILNTESDNTVKYDDLTYGNLNMDSPVQWLNNVGLNLYVMMISDGGQLTSESKAGYLLLTNLHTESSKCANDPGIATFTVGPEGNRYRTTPVWISPLRKESCYELAIYPGTDPVDGGIVSFATTVPNGSTIYSRSSASPSFGAGTKGCILTQGGTGGFGTFQPELPEAKDFSSVMKCTGTKIKQSNGGYKKKNHTVTAISPKPTGVVRYGSKQCFYDVSVGDWTGECPPVWNIIDDNPPKKWNLKTFGNFALIWNELNKGVNFYAKGGNPGEHRTLYIPRFAESVRIKPGRPLSPGKTVNNQAGYDTTMEYISSGRIILKAPGGKKPISSQEGGTEAKTTFIMGNLFNPVPAPGHVIAYDTENGVQTDGLKPGSDDKSGDSREYGTYFLPKESSFIYPIPDITNPIPDTVGRGGHGAYTVYRRPGLADAYAMHRLDSTPNKDKATVSKGSIGAIVSSAYKCKSTNEDISGTQPPTPYRCYAGAGQGGAVVITW